MPDRVSVSSADFIRNIGHWQMAALAHPISITHHGRERLVLASSDRFQSNDEAQAVRDGGPPALLAWRDALLANIEQGFLQVDASLNVCATNHIAQAFFGLTEGGFKSLTADGLFMQYLNGTVRNALTRVLRTRIAEAVETVLPDKRVVSLRVFPVPDGVALLFSNISEQLLTQLECAEAAALRASLAVFQDIGEVRLDVRGRISRVDCALAHALGFSADQLVEHRISDLVDSSARRSMNAAIEAMLPDRASQFLDLTFISRRGDPIEARMSMTPIFHQYTPQGAACMVALAPAA
jgi:PAS domain-containing protein